MLTNSACDVSNFFFSFSVKIHMKLIVTSNDVTDSNEEEHIREETFLSQDMSEMTLFQVLYAEKNSYFYYSFFYSV